MNLPINIEAEDCLLSSFMCSFRAVGCILAERGVNPEMFHGPGNPVIASEMIGAWREGVELDAFLLLSRLRASGRLKDAGGESLFVKITQMPTAANVSQYIDIVLETDQLRRVAILCAEKGREAVLDGAEAHSIVSGLSEAITAIAGVKNKAPTLSMKQLSQEKLRRIEGDEDDKDILVTGIQKLDYYSPLRMGDMPLISGERKSGKSILSLNIAMNLAERGHSGLYCSLEDKCSKVFDRMFARITKIPLGRHHVSGMAEREMQQIAVRLPKLAELPIDLRDDLHDLHAIVAVIRQKAAQDPKFKWAVVDYAQLVRTQARKGANKEEEVATISRTLRLLAIELNVAIILLCQLNKEGNARWSMGLEHDCTAMWKVVVPEDHEGERHIEIPFQRNGDSQIMFKVAFMGSTCRIEALAE